MCRVATACDKALTHATDFLSDLVQLEDEEGAVVVDAARQLRVCFTHERELVCLACPFSVPNDRKPMAIASFSIGDSKFLNIHAPWDLWASAPRARN